MGVTGLWRLIEPAGKPVPVETLENKVLAVDISIWLHQIVKGYQDAKGAPLPNSHLMGLFQRLCKLLYFRIKPVFVFDGGFPDLKKETIAKRQHNKLKYNSESERLKRELALLLSKKTAINSLLGKQISPSKKSTSSGAPADNDDLFKLPALPNVPQESDSESEEESSSSSSVDLHSIDINSDKFKSLPVKEKYDLLVEIKETRKMNSWGRLHELPKKSDNFSDFQMQRLLKRRKVQECLEETEKEMGDVGMSLNELESFLNEEGIDTKIESLPSRRIASNDTTRFLLINNVRQTLAEAKKKKEVKHEAAISKVEEEVDVPKKDELEEDLEKAIKMSLECVNETDTSACTSKTDDSWTSCLTDTDYSSDSEEGDGFEQPDMSSAKAYIMQYSDFTNRAINDIVGNTNKTTKNKSKVPKVKEILDEINNEKSVIVDNIDLSSDEETVESIQRKENVKIDEDQLQNVSDLDSSYGNQIDMTQASVMFIENPIPEVITLDTSIEDKEYENAQLSQFNDNEITGDKTNPSFNENQVFKVKEESESSEEEFEDVPDVSNKPIVQVTLDIEKEPNIADDIFADVFEGNQVPKVETVDKNVDNCADLIIKNVIENKPLGSNDIFEKNNTATLLNKEETIVEHSLTTHVDSLPHPNQDASIETITKDKVKVTDNKIIYDDNSSSKEYVNQPNNLQLDLIKPADSDTSAELSSKIFKTPEIPKEKTNIVKEPLSVETLNNMVEEIQTEERGLLGEKGRLDRVGRNISEQMTKEAQELLQIFGIPYIVAPMEAEAQCAFLESINLTDGTITDDSDIWLFGAKTVYKNFFNQKKHVLQFVSERIEKSFNLTREQLVLLALLVGSDYTTGIPGVGPVTALEILASFPFSKKKLLNETSKQGQYAEILSGLQDFKQWVRKGKRTDNCTLKKKLKNVDVTDDFPSIRVFQAYMEPNVEKSSEKFTWGNMDITILRDYTKAKFGWSQNKLDEIIKPVMKRMLDHKKQRSVQDYFKRKIEFQSLEDQLSKRVKAAVQRMDPEKSIQDEPKSLSEHKSVRKRKTKSDKPESKAGSSKAKQMKSDETSVLLDHGVKVVSQLKDGKTSIEIKIPKSDRVQEIIPQREKDKQSLLENKLKAIEVFRKTKIDKKNKMVKKKPLKPKEKADLSESSDSS